MLELELYASRNFHLAFAETPLLLLLFPCTAPDLQLHLDNLYAHACL